MKDKACEAMDAIKPDAAYWWERTPTSGHARHARLVNTDGTLNNNNANNANGLAPDCEIVRFE